MSGPLTLMDVYAQLRTACEHGQAAWAKDHDLSPSYVNDVLNARRDPGPAILKALGLRAVTYYLPKECANV